jgi:hypothetical protein
VTETWYLQPPSRALPSLQVWSKSVSKERHFILLWPKLFVVPIAPRIAAGWLKYHTLNSQPILYSHWKFGRNRWVTKGTLLERRNLFLSLWTHIAGGRQTWIMLLTVDGPQEVQVWSKSVRNKGYFTVETVTVFSPYLYSHCSGWRKQQTVHTCPWSATCASLIQIGQ